MFCQKCGSELLEGAIFCSMCGAKVEEETTEAPEATNTIGRKRQHINRPAACLAMVFALLSIPVFFMAFYGNTFEVLIRSQSFFAPIGSVLIFLICFLSMLDVRAGSIPCALMLILSVVRSVIYLKAMIISAPASYITQQLPSLLLPEIINVSFFVLLLIALLLKSMVRRILAIICVCIAIVFIVSGAITMSRLGLPTSLFGSHWIPIRNIIEDVALLIVSAAAVFLPVEHKNEVV